jgi:hypothetical protein
MVEYMPTVISVFPTDPIKYYSIGGPTEPDTFKSPRQKIWGIFIADGMNSTTTKIAWTLVHTTNAVTEIRKLFDEFLRNPPQSNVTNGFVGMDHIIAVEIIPADFMSKIGALS